MSVLCLYSTMVAEITNMSSHWEKKTNRIFHLLPTPPPPFWVVSLFWGDKEWQCSVWLALFWETSYKQTWWKQANLAQKHHCVCWELLRVFFLRSASWAPDAPELLLGCATDAGWKRLTNSIGLGNQHPSLAQPPWGHVPGTRSWTHSKQRMTLWNACRLKCWSRWCVCGLHRSASSETSLYFRDV